MKNIQNLDLYTYPNNIHTLSSRKEATWNGSYSISHCSGSTGHLCI